jgi:hypothetical protein
VSMPDFQEIREKVIGKYMRESGFLAMFRQ